MGTNQTSPCEQCVLRKKKRGDGTSTCFHPEVNEIMEDEYLRGALLIMAREEARKTPEETSRRLLDSYGVSVDPEGLLRGEATWPISYDPKWVRACTAFTPTERRDHVH